MEKRMGIVHTALCSGNVTSLAGQQQRRDKRLNTATMLQDVIAKLDHPHSSDNSSPMASVQSEPVPNQAAVEASEERRMADEMSRLQAEPDVADSEAGTATSCLKGEKERNLELVGAETGAGADKDWEEATAAGSTLARMFEEADADGSGRLDSEELSALMKRFYQAQGKSRSAKRVRLEVEASMAEYDSEGNGGLDLKQFVKMVAESDLFNLPMSKESRALLLHIDFTPHS
eukprot:TRINITY_DN7013_c0_g1_i1.p1 TRINITY_DN7013_c0_g1~~TRINITY_DN7013_c0_g1_i1.p1  ORF type:complete len:232 (+),score=60.81 TRINITY_DN7013_c0_g1_i1:228-923(+)